MCKINLLDKVSFLLVMIGALNWGLVGLLDINLITTLVGSSEIITRLVYILVFLSALDIVYLLFRCNIIKLPKSN